MPGNCYINNLFIQLHNTLVCILNETERGPKEGAYFKGLFGPHSGPHFWGLLGPLPGPLYGSAGPLCGGDA